MASISDILKKQRKFERGWKKQLAQTLRTNQKIIINLQLSQLLAGQDRFGNTLSPTYSQDSFFKTPESAARYEARKTKKASYHERLKYYDFGSKPAGVPNLIYARSLAASRFYRHMRVQVTEETIKIFNIWSKGGRVETKYPTALGLQKRAFAIFWNRKARKDLIYYWYSL